jgi:hypothetical protein
VPGFDEPETGAGAEDPGPAEGSDGGGVPAQKYEASTNEATVTAGRGRRARLAFRRWRRTRAFWGGFLLVLSGSEILFTYNAPFKVVLHFGLYGIAGYALPLLVLILGLLVWFDPEHRVFYSVIALFAAAGTWLTSNLGGFFIGMLLGLAGATLTYGWSDAPITPKEKKRKKAEALAAANGDQGPRTAAS